MAFPRIAHTSFVLNGKLYVAGGIDGKARQHWALACVAGLSNPFCRRCRWKPSSASILPRKRGAHPCA